MAYRYRDLIVDGKRRGTIHLLENIGDIFPIHTHNEYDNHITVMAYGKVKVLGKHEGKIIEAAPGGTIINWKPDEPHGFEALTEGATLVNLVKSQWK